MANGGNPTSGMDRMIEYVTVMVAGQMFGLPIARVHDVFLPERLTPVPRAPREVSGILNLRGRIVTAIDMRARLGLPAKPDGMPGMAVGIDQGGESYALLVDGVGEVLKLEAGALERPPVNLDDGLTAICIGVHRLEGQLLVVLDVDRVLDIGTGAVAA
jgi:purine-binding chemotaxis protein CheW